MVKIKVLFVQNRQIQFTKNEKRKIINPEDFYNAPGYNIYIDGKCLSHSFFRFYFNLEIVKILNAKSFCIKTA